MGPLLWLQTQVLSWDPCPSLCSHGPLRGSTPARQPGPGRARGLLAGRGSHGPSQGSALQVKAGGGAPGAIARDPLPSRTPRTGRDLLWAVNQPLCVSVPQPAFFTRSPQSAHRTVPHEAWPPHTSLWLAECVCPPPRGTAGREDPPPPTPKRVKQTGEREGCVQIQLPIHPGCVACEWVQEAFQPRRHRAGPRPLAACALSPPDSSAHDTHKIEKEFSRPLSPHPRPRTTAYLLASHTPCQPLMWYPAQMAPSLEVSLMVFSPTLTLCFYYTHPCNTSDVCLPPGATSPLTEPVAPTASPGLAQTRRVLGDESSL